MRRRTLLQGATAVAAGLALPWPGRVMAAHQASDAFAVRTEAEVLGILFGQTTAIPSERIVIELPVHAKQGESVACRVSCDLDAADIIAIVSRKNRYPLNTYVRLYDAAAYYNTRIRLDETSTVTAYVRSGGELYAATTDIKINPGGYGMHHE